MVLVVGYTEPSPDDRAPAQYVSTANTAFRGHAKSTYVAPDNVWQWAGEQYQEHFRVGGSRAGGRGAPCANGETDN